MKGHRPRLPAVMTALALALALAPAAIPGARTAWAGAPAEDAPELVPREEMIDALLRFAASGGCETRRKVFGPHFDATCREPDEDGGEWMSMWLLLDSLPDRELAERCRRNRIVDCEALREVSKGRPILTFESALDIEFNASRATWRADGRLLLLDGLDLPASEVRVLDVAAGRLLDPPLYAGPIFDAAWSPDGAIVALSDRTRAAPEQPLPVGAVRLYDARTRKPVGSVSAADAGCTLGLLDGMAFTADSRALWVLCAQADKTAKAVRLGVPGLRVEDSFAPVSPNSGLPEIHWEEGVQRHGADLIVTARFRSPPPGRGPRPLVQSYSLRTKAPLYAPIPAVAGSARLAPDLSGLYIGEELWSTRTGQRVATGVKPAGRYLGAPGRIPGLGRGVGLHIEAKPQPGSQRSALAVVDSATGATVQELGPVPPVVSILVAPNGERVAVAGFQGIRFYRVSLDAAVRSGRFQSP